MTTEDKTKPVTEMYEQAVKNYEQALKAGLKAQEESVKVWAGFLNQGATPQDWQKKAKTVADDLIPQAQKAVDDGLKLVEQNSRTSVELLKKAVAATHSTSPQDAQTKLLSFWESSLNAMRDSAVAVTQANNKAIDSWVAYVRKSGEATATPTTGAKA